MGLLKAPGVILIKMTPSGRECVYESIRTGWKACDGPSPEFDCQLLFDWQGVLNIKVRTGLCAVDRWLSFVLCCIVDFFSHASIKRRSFSAAFGSCAKNRDTERIAGLSELQRERSGGLHLVYRWIFSPSVSLSKEYSLPQLDTEN